MADNEVNADWSANANKALSISLVSPRAQGLETVHTFNPEMSYSIFGEAETVFGYQGLKMNLRYHASDMRPNLQITYNKKFKTVGETGPTDLKAIMEPLLPKTAFEKFSVFEGAIADPINENFQPPGELWETIEADGQTYEIWKGDLADLAVQQMLKRIQILVLFFIDGSNLLDVDEVEWSVARWTVFFLYQKKAVVDAKVSPYTFMGYSTVYRYFFFTPLPPPLTEEQKKEQHIHPVDLDFKLPFPEVAISDLKCRSRLSQFLVLPPFHKGGHGSRLYNSIFDFYLQDSKTIEMTVEDPNEAFDDMRDLNDLARLRKDEEFSALRLNTAVVPRAKGVIPQGIVDADKLDKMRKRFKIAPRQFARLVEMHLLSFIPTSIRQSLIHERQTGTQTEIKAKQHEYHLWNLLTKQRLYRHNKDALMQLDRTDRIDKLDEALGSVEADYARLLRAFDAREKVKAKAARDAKRALPPDGTTEGEPASKKPKLT